MRAFCEGKYGFKTMRAKIDSEGKMRANEGALINEDKVASLWATCQVATNDINFQP